MSGIFALGTAVRAYYLRGRGQATMRWRPVDGKITWSIVDETTINTRKGSRTAYRADIKYTYMIGTHEHQGTQVYAVSPRWDTSDTAPRELVDLYRPGQTVTVFVNPTQVTETVLVHMQESEIRFLWRSALAAAAVSITVWLLRSRL